MGFRSHRTPDDAPALLAPTCPRAAVVILNWNNARETVSCLETLSGATDVIVVDNGSTDGSQLALRETCPGSLIELDHNSGFARGVNAGLRVALSQRFDVIVFLNNDARLERHTVENAVSTIWSHKDIGLLTGKIVDDAGRIWYGGGRLHRLRGGVAIRGQREPDRGQCDQAADVSFVSLAFAVTRRDVLEQVGLLDEAYFFGQEEWDFSLRVRQRGYRLRYDPRLHCVHGGDGSHDNRAPEYVYNGYRNKLIFQQRHLPRPLFRLWRVAFSVYIRTIMPAKNRRFHFQRMSPGVLRYCAQEALRDDAAGTGRVEESDLRAFRRRVESEFGDAPAATGL